MFLKTARLLASVVCLAACAGPAASPPTGTPGRSSAAGPTATQAPAPTDSAAPPTAAPTGTAAAGPPTSTAESTATPAPANWQDWPIVPTVSHRARDIFAHGQVLGRNPHSFAKAGDCGGTPSWFLGPFDGDASLYQLGSYAYLNEVIAYFSGSFNRSSVAARPGFNASSIFSPLWSDSAQCRANEGPLICEIRVTNASYAFIMLGANDVWHPEQFEPQMRRAIDDLIQRGVVPILATKADNIEQNGSINAAIVRLAGEYDVPLWNFWRAVKDLPYHGLQPDGVHLTWAGNHFDDPKTMSHGWPVRNLTALEALDAVWRGVNGAK
jgi:hypothetical protein